MGGNPTEHVTILPFTRSLAGPFDYTPGVFDILLRTKPGEQVKTTIGKELALYTVIYAPMQMANDLPENYNGHPAFEYIKDVPTDWETTRVLNGKIGEFVTIARQERDGANWYVGGVTNQEARKLDIALDFLQPDASYVATVYSDTEATHYLNRPTDYERKEYPVTAKETLSIQLAPGGGFAMKIEKK